MCQMIAGRKSPDDVVLEAFIATYLRDHAGGVARECLARGNREIVQRMLVEAVTAEHDHGSMDADEMDRVLAIIGIDPSQVIRTVGNARCYALRGH